MVDGPAPEILVLVNEGTEKATVATSLTARVDEGLDLREIALFVRTDEQVNRAHEAATEAGLEVQVLTDSMDICEVAVVISTMLRAQGLGFRAVIVMACDDEVTPLQPRVENVGDEADLEDVYETERHLLYVACRLARDRQLVTGIDPGSEFLEDLAISS